MNKYVPATGNSSAKIVLVGEAPSYEEEVEGRPFVGPSGRFLDSLLRAANIDRSNCWVTNVSKYAVPANPKKGVKKSFTKRFYEAYHNTDIKLDDQLQELKYELAQIRPNVVIPLGGTALWALTGKTNIQQMRGSICRGWGYKLVPTYHPAHILHQSGEVSGYWNKHVMIADLIRAKNQSEFPELNLPSRLLKVIKSSGELYGFIEQYKEASNPAIDIEAHQCIPICVGIAFNRHHGITVPLWNTIGISSIPDGDLVNIWSLLADFLAKHEVVGQNFGYDRDKLKRLGFIVKGLHSDTMLKAFCINPEFPKNLAFNTSIYTEEPYYKDEGMYEGSFEDLLIGCARDACVTKEVDEEHEKDINDLQMGDYYRNFVLPLHDLYAGVEQTGFRTDDEKQRQYIRKYIEWSSRLDYELFKIAGVRVNVNSPKQVASLLFDNWKVPVRAGTGENELTAILNGKIKHDIHRLGIEKILEKRRVDKALGTYGYALTDYDGRMRTSYFICLKTGRSSTMQQEPPVRPIYEYKDYDGKKKTQARGMAFQTITKHGDIGTDIRTIFIPDDGECFLQVDSAQAEARVIFLLAEDYEALELIDKVDYHALTASWFFGGDEQKYSKKVLGFESPERFTGKTLRHACHLGAGKRTAKDTVNNDARRMGIDYKISEPFAEKCINIFHAKQPRIQRVFQRQVREILQKTRTLYAPVPYGIDAKVGGRRMFFERESEQFYREAFSYIPQRTVSENTKGAALRIRKKHPWIRILVEAHDGLLVSSPIGRKLECARILTEEMQVPIDFRTCSLPRGELVIPAEVEWGMNYKDMERIKL